MTYKAHWTCEYCGKLRCECSPGWSVLDYVYEKAFDGRIKSGAPVLPADCNTRFSVTSPSPALLNVLNGELTPRQFVQVLQTTSHFHAHVIREGRATFYETHTSSIAYGLELHRQRVHENHVQKGAWTTKP